MSYALLVISEGHVRPCLRVKFVWIEECIYIADKTGVYLFSKARMGWSYSFQMQWCWDATGHLTLAITSKEGRLREGCFEQNVPLEVILLGFIGKLNFEHCNIRFGDKSNLLQCRPQNRKIFWTKALTPPLHFMKFGLVRGPSTRLPCLRVPPGPEHHQGENVREG